MSNAVDCRRLRHTACAATDAARPKAPPPVQGTATDSKDAWSKAQEHMHRGEPHQGTVVRLNRGGVIVDCWGVQGASKLRSAPVPSQDANRPEVMGLMQWDQSAAIGRAHVLARFCGRPKSGFAITRARALGRWSRTRPRRPAGRAGFIPNSLVSSKGRPEEGVPVVAHFVEVDELRNRLILSQKQLEQTSLLQTVKPGNVVEVRDCQRCPAFGHGPYLSQCTQNGRAAASVRRGFRCLNALMASQPAARRRVECPGSRRTAPSLTSRCQMAGQSAP